MATREQIVKQAQAWLGFSVASGKHKQIIDVYNAHKPLARGYKVKYTDAWCATFVSAVSIKCGATGIMPTECGCGEMIKLYQKLGEWQEKDSYTPQPGDVIFYDWEDNGIGDNKGGANHVGIVEKVVGNTITVIEGNYKASVTRRNIEINGKYIRGYGLPKFAVVANKELTTEELEKMAKDVIAGKYGNGAEREKALGANYKKVQARVNEILEAQKIDKLAQEVLQGKYGNGKERETKLGKLYATVQKRVNEIYK